MAQPPFNPIPDLFKRAMVAQNNRQADLARALYGKILSINEKLPEVHYQLGRLELSQDAPRKALVHLRHARALKPGEPVIWTTMLDAMMAMRDEKSIAKLLRTAKNANLPAPLLRTLATKAASRNKQGVARVGTADPAAIQAAMRQFESGDFKGAEAAAAALHAAHPKVATILAVLGAAQAGLGKQDAAEASYRKAIALDPTYGEAHLQFGQLLLRRGQDDAAIATLEQAQNLVPDSPFVLKFLGVAYHKKGRRVLALPLLERALIDIPDDPELLGPLADCLLAHKRSQEAKAITARMIEAGTENEEVYLLHGRILSDLEENDAAMAAYETALSLNPKSGAARSAIAMLAQQVGRFEDAERYMEQAFALGTINGEQALHYARTHKASADDTFPKLFAEIFEQHREEPGSRAEMAFALAKIAEDQQDFPRAFRFLHDANNLLKEEGVRQDERLWRPGELARRAFEKGVAPAVTAAPSGPPAMIFVTGMPRSGTTLVEQIIASHSRVTAGGEIGYLHDHIAPVLELADAQSRDITGDDLRKCGREITRAAAANFPGAGVVSDKGLFAFNYIGLMPQVLPDAKFIVVRRDPRDNCLSMYKNRFAPGMHQYTNDLETLAQTYLRYLEALRFWRERCPEAFLEIRYDTLIADPEAQTRALIDDCGLPWEDACLRFHETKRKVNTLSLYQVRQPLYASSVGGWRRYERELKPLIDILQNGGALEEWD